MNKLFALTALVARRGARTPVWSDKLTLPLAALIGHRWRAGALTAIKAIHTAIFASVGASILLIVWDGLWQRPRRRTVVARERP